MFEDENRGFVFCGGMTLTATAQALSLQEFLDNSFHQTPAMTAWEGE